MDTKASIDPPPDDLHRLIQEAMTLLGVEADPAKLAAAVRRLNLGLPAEDEFSVICAWLGRCHLIHKLDQQQAPAASRELFQVPDLQALFHDAPACLIEVKASRDSRLSMKPDYYRRLRAYADALRQPLLIAWKHLGVWVLFDAAHLKLARTNYNIGFFEALRHNLMGVLAGDVSYQLQAGSALNLVFAKEELTSTEVNETGRSETWRMRVADAYLSDGNGERRTDFHPESTQLLLTWPLEESEVHSEKAVEKRFFVGEATNVFAHQALVALLNWESLKDSRLNWRSLLGLGPATKTVTDFRRALQRALSEGLVRYIFNQVPAEWPDYIPRKSNSGLVGSERRQT